MSSVLFFLSLNLFWHLNFSITESSKLLIVRHWLNSKLFISHTTRILEMLGRFLTWIKWKLKDFKITWANILFTIDHREHKCLNWDILHLSTRWAHFKFDACYKSQKSCKENVPTFSEFGLYNRTKVSTFMILNYYNQWMGIHKSTCNFWWL